MDIFKFNIKKNINEKEYFKNGSIILLGEFETFHKGHKKLLDQAKKIQKNEKIGILLIEKNKSTFQTVENRLINLASLGFDFVVFVEFNFEFMSIEGNDFISYLDKNFNIKNYIVGKDFKFGKNRKFSSSDIKNLTNANLYVIDILKIGNVKVSSSEIKRMHEFGEYNLIKELVINPLVFDITIYDKKIKWEQKIEIPQFGNYFFSILIDDFWYQDRKSTRLNSSHAQ